MWRQWLVMLNAIFKKRKENVHPSGLCQWVPGCLHSLHVEFVKNSHSFRYKCVLFINLLSDYRLSFPVNVKLTCFCFGLFWTGSKQPCKQRIILEGNTRINGISSILISQEKHALSSVISGSAPLALQKGSKFSLWIFLKEIKFECQDQDQWLGGGKAKVKSL